jgi:hypothetical protein
LKNELIKIQRATNLQGGRQIFKVFVVLQGLSPHRRPLKERMRDKTVSYFDLLRPDPPPSRRDDKKKSEACRRLETRMYN